MTTRLSRHAFEGHSSTCRIRSRQLRPGTVNTKQPGRKRRPGPMPSVAAICEASLKVRGAAKTYG